ncbi:hypothetical protein BDV38DRAFT_238755 [Aspergillus pseudotamarii]|uniref:Uncharacterized protein n=1 Tax=Aspergillus pseudotamarii TaxID=132259 RepID=A0A5N6T498_ASPPS|nr:uncharacterized protein BDV38DRAFT_238755 [Aspergillus pseudotamarii]KAE8141125.1 hypothetical protein BDV38DRAFT_238755 [Aspergillus pseudotamarii]
MPTPTADPEFLLPDPTVQQRRLQNTTQNQTAASRLQDASRSAGESRKEDLTSGMTLQEFLQTTMDKDGNPVPDPNAFTDGAKMQKGSRALDEADLVDAAWSAFD